MNKRHLGISLAIGTAGGLLPLSARAEVTLDFEDFGSTNQIVPDTYGDNLPGAPNIDLTWNTDGWQTYQNWDGRSTVVQMDYDTVGSPILSLDLQADSGFGVYVREFELDEWAGGGDTVVNWSLISGGSTLYSGVWDEFSNANGGNGGRTLIATGMDSSSAVFDTLQLQFELVSGDTTYVAMDNLTFGQVTAVPEPSSALVLALGGLGAAVMRRRRSLRS